MEARDRLLRRSSWLPLLARLGTLPRLTGGSPVVCMGVFLCFYACAHRRAARFLYSSLRSAPPLCWGCPCTKLAAHPAERRRRRRVHCSSCPSEGRGT